MFAFVIYKLGAFLAKSVPLPTARRSAHVVGSLMCFLQRRTRKTLFRNLQVAFGDQLSTRELRLLRRKIFQNFAVFVTDFLRMPLVNRDNLSDYLTEDSFSSIMSLAKAATPETPTISTTAHLGNWEFGAASMGLLAGPITVLVDTHPSSLVTKFFDGRRADKGVDVVPVSAFHRCFRALKQGRLVAIVGDRPVTGQGVRTEYFGREALMPDGYAVLARRFGASIIPTFLVMTPTGKYRFMTEDPITPPVTDDFEADVRECIVRCIEIMERYVRQYREQWYVFRPIWDEQRTSRQDRHGRRMMRARRLGAQVAGTAGRVARRRRSGLPAEPKQEE